MTLRTSPGSSRKSSAPATQRSRPVEGAFDFRDMGVGTLLVLLGCALLAGLFEAAESLRFDTLLVASKSIYNVISGVRGIGMGIGQMLLGLAQMLGFAALAAVSIAAVLAIFSGAVRIGSHTLPRLNTVWNLLSQSLHLILQFLAVPLSGGRELRPQRSPKLDSQLEQPQRSISARNRRAA
ncbi:MAG: hypothetical protein WCI65_03275 [Synechococcaceae cyanobacterium ELA263]